MHPSFHSASSFCYVVVTVQEVSNRLTSADNHRLHFSAGQSRMDMISYFNYSVPHQRPNFEWKRQIFKIEKLTAFIDNVDSPLPRTESCVSTITISRVDAALLRAWHARGKASTPIFETKSVVWVHIHTLKLCQPVKVMERKTSKGFLGHEVFNHAL